MKLGLLAIKMRLSLWSLTSVSVNMAFVTQSWLCIPENTLLLSMCTSVWNSGDDVSLHLWALPCLEQHKSLNWAEMFVFGLLPLFSLTFHVDCHQRKSLYSVPLHNPGVGHLSPAKHLMWLRTGGLQRPSSLLHFLNKQMKSSSQM